MNTPTLVKNHSVALSVTTNAQHQVIYGDMKEPTLVKNHLVARIVKRNLQLVTVWENIKENASLRNKLSQSRSLKKSRLNLISVFSVELVRSSPEYRLLILLKILLVAYIK